MNNLPNPFDPSHPSHPCLVPPVTSTGVTGTNNINSNVLSKLNELKKINTNQNILNLSFFKDKKDSIQIKTNYNSQCPGKGSFLNILNKLTSNYNQCLVNGGNSNNALGELKSNNSNINIANATNLNNNSVKLQGNIKQQQIVKVANATPSHIRPLKKLGKLHTYLKNNLFPSQGLAGFTTKTNLSPAKGKGENNLISPNPGTGKKKSINGTIFHYNKFIDYNFNNNKPLPLSFNFKNSVALASLSNTSKGENLISSQGQVLVNNLNMPNQILSGHLDTNKFINYTDNLLVYFFKSMYCLISKPVYLITPEKVTIQLFYFLNIPKKKIFKLYYLFYNNRFKKHWIKNRSMDLKKLRLRIKKNKGIVPLSLVQKRNRLLKIARTIKIYNSTRLRIKLRWKKRRPILRLRSKFNTVLNLLLKLRRCSIDTVYKFKFNLICSILSNKFNRPVELQLIRLHHPYHDSNILVNLLALNLKNKKKKSRVAISKIHSNKVIKKLNDPNLKSINLIPSFLSGLNINIAGRLMREPIIPRKTTKFYEKGATATGKVNYLDVATITKKNKKGAFTIKISSGQNLF